MGMNNKKLNKSNYSSELEKYINKQEESSSDDSNFNLESNFQTSKNNSKLDKYLGINEKEKNEEEINYCSICGNPLKKFNYGDKCDDCVKKINLVPEINTLLDYISPSEELKKDTLLFAGFDELKLNILISNLLNENLIIFGSNGIFLNDVKSLNNFFRIYGSEKDILDESLYKNLIFSEDFVDISKYSDLVQIIFNSKNNKWEVNLFRDGNSVLKKFFKSIIDANNYATHYLKELGELDNLYDKKPIEKTYHVKYKKSKEKFIYFSTKRNQWYVRVKGFKGSKLVGFYDSEEEAVIARDNYIKEKKANHARLMPYKHHKNESDAIISFHERSNQWIVKVKKKRGGYKRLGYYDTEEEAIAAKNEYYGIDDELKDNLDLDFYEGDRVQIISGRFEFEFGIIKGYFEERDSFIVELENLEVPYPVLIKSNLLKLV